MGWGEGGFHRTSDPFDGDRDHRNIVSLDKLPVPRISADVQLPQRLGISPAHLPGDAVQRHRRGAGVDVPVLEVRKVRDQDRDLTVGRQCLVYPRGPSTKNGKKQGNRPVEVQQ